MSEKAYIRNQKDPGGSKFISKEDCEDFEQEKAIQEWLKNQGNAGEFNFKYISSKGTARNTLVRAQVRLDQEITEDGSGTFANLIAGSDGRNLLERGDDFDSEVEAREVIHGYLFALGLNQGEVDWVIKTLKLSIQENKLLFERSAIDSEW